METQDIYEVWNKEKSGVLSVEPLIYKACKEGKMGNIFSYPDGCIFKTVFTYLCGKPDEKIVSEHPELIYGTRLVCMSSEWEEYIKRLSVKFVLRRKLMEPLNGSSSKVLAPLPEGYSVSCFTREIFDEHPFDQGRSYKDHDDFLKRGAGAAILYNGKVVSASSSFITVDDHVELDVFTDPDHRKKGLADHCVFEMMKQCNDKGLTIHWDAQNPMSSNMAISHGFTSAAEYAVYWLE